MHSNLYKLTFSYNIYGYTFYVTIHDILAFPDSSCFGVYSAYVFHILMTQEIKCATFLFL